MRAFRLSSSVVGALLSATLFSSSLPMLIADALFFLALLVPVLLFIFAERKQRDRRVIAFLHPFCNDGGGGERVLWVAVRELLARGVLDPATWSIVVYTGDAISDDDIRHHAARRFGVEIPACVRFVRLARRGWIEPKRYPVATLLGQAFGSLVLGAEAILREPPDVLVDTTGLHFCLPLLRYVFGVRRLACYVHYPLVSSDMLGAVAGRRAAHNNRSVFARFALGAALKLGYYKLLVLLYRRAGRTSDVTMANGSWTAAHVRSLWGVTPRVVFPPCDTRRLQALPLDGPAGGRTPRLVLSVAQFRPEKDHALQLRAFALVLRKWQAMGSPEPRPTLVLAGAVRHADDQARLEALEALAATLLAEHCGGAGGGEGAALVGAVKFAPNLPLEELRELFGRARVGLHTMWNEHFGIGVVEMQAAGLAVVAHRSGGPALDIIEHGRTGMLAESAEEYAEAMGALLLQPGCEARCREMGAAARQAVATRFSEESFAEGLCDAMRPLVDFES